MKKYLFLLAFILFLVPSLTRAQEGFKMSITPPLIKNNVSPGQIWKSSIKVVNNNKESINVYLDTMDFKGGNESGTVEFLENVSENEKENQHLLSRWIVIDPGPFEIPAQGSKEISFIIDVPDNVSPGGHYASILAGTKPPEDQVQGSNIKVSSLLGSLILLNVKGDVKEEGQIREFSSEKTVYPSPEVDFTVRFQNTGNVHIQPQGEIRVYNWLGADKGHMTLNHNSEFGNVLPDGIRKWNFTWEGEKGLLSMGRYRANLILSYGQAGRQTDSREFYFWVLNFKVIGITLGVFVAVLFFFIFLIRLYIKHTIKVAQKQVEMMTPPQTKVTPRATIAERKVVDLKKAPQNKKTLKNTKAAPKPSVWRFFRNFIFAVVFVSLCVGGYLFYQNTNQKEVETPRENMEEPREEPEQEEPAKKEEEIIASSSDDISEPPEEEKLEKPLIKKEDLRIAILNGSGTSGKAGSAGTIFEEAGYKIERLGNADNFDYVSTKIEYKKEFKDFAENAADMMAVSADLVVNNLLVEDILIIVGKDF